MILTAVTAKGFCIFAANPGAFQATTMPRTIGTTNMKRVCVKNATTSKFIVVKSSLVGGYNDNQNNMDIGVMNAAAKLEVAVIETESAVLPRPNNVIILEILPPGQQDTKIIPRARLGMGLSKYTKPSVSSGRPTICANTPAR